MKRLPTLGPALGALGSAYSSILFTTNMWLGWVLIAATFIRPVSGLAGVIAALTANVAASALGYRVDAVRSGQYGLNAALVGLALSVGRGLDGPTLLLCMLGGVGTVFLTAFAADVLHRGLGLCPLVLPFVAIATVAMPVLHHASAPLLLDQPLIAGEPPEGFAGLVLKSFAAIVFQTSPLAGALVLIGCLIASRISTLFAIGGVCVALATARFIHADPWLELPASYNGALTAIAVGTFFFVPSRASFLAALITSGLAAWVSLAMAAIGWPVLAWPFVLVTLVAVRAIRLKSPDRAPYPPPLPGQSPEANVEHVATFERRFGVPGPPQFYLPVAGKWFISQGAKGAHTHRGAWEGALDFEIADDKGFPFRGEGTQLDDYFCFNAPVYAPGSGTVVAVHDGRPDNNPGEMDLSHPWGNAVVLQHGPDLFTVLAHLHCGSIVVKPGQHVAAGQPVGACGSSGRSPRPHLHMQAQRTAELGAAAVPFRLLHYTRDERYVAMGLPAEGEVVAAALPSATMSTFAALPPGAEIVLASEDDDRTFRFRSELSLLGERSLVDLDRGDRLYFQVSYGSTAFTTYRGSASGPLRALFLAMPRLPSINAPLVRFTDEPPPALLLPGAMRWAYELVRVFLDPIRTSAAVELQTTGETVLMHTKVGVGLFSATHPRFRAETEIDAAGIARIEVIDLRNAKRPLLRARRVS